MTRDFIKLRDVMKHFYSGLPADITFVTFSKVRKTGGKIKKLKQVTLMSIEGRDGKEVIANHVPEELSTKKPNHHLHGTINVRTKMGEPHKLRKIFITEFNGKEVLL